MLSRFLIGFFVGFCPTSIIGNRERAEGTLSTTGPKWHKFTGAWGDSWSTCQIPTSGLLRDTYVCPQNIGCILHSITNAYGTKLQVSMPNCGNVRPTIWVNEQFGHGDSNNLFSLRLNEYHDPGKPQSLELEIRNDVSDLIKTFVFFTSQDGFTYGEKRAGGTWCESNTHLTERQCHAFAWAKNGAPAWPEPAARNWRSLWAAGRNCYWLLRENNLQIRWNPKTDDGHNGAESTDWGGVCGPSTDP